jgi:hypothetical protein
VTPREGFRFGFYYRCAEEGLDATGARERAGRALEKRADDKGWWPVIKGIGGGIGGGIGSIGKHLAGLGLLAGVGGPIALGTGVGLGLANAREQDIDPEEVRRQELIAAYNFHADQARQRAKLRHFQTGGQAR